MPTTPVQALPYPALSDPANGPVAMQNLALALEDYKTLVRCTSSTRPAHVEGRVIYETDTDRMQVSNGTAWIVLSAGWQAYTPTLASGTVGTGVGSIAGRYSQIGKTVHFEVRWVLGTGYAITSNTVIGTPVNRANSLAVYGSNVRVAFVDTPAGNVFLGVGIQWSTGVSPYTLGTNSIATNAGTPPFTLSAGDEVHIAGTYECV